MGSIPCVVFALAPEWILDHNADHPVPIAYSLARVAVDDFGYRAETSPFAHEPTLNRTRHARAKVRVLPDAKLGIQLVKWSGIQWHSRKLK
jgi:hypothetical protein